MQKATAHTTVKEFIEVLSSGLDEGTLYILITILDIDIRADHKN